MAKPFYFWQTVSKKAKWQPWPVLVFCDLGEEKKLCLNFF
jgi:hypothetical protein